MKVSLDKDGLAQLWRDGELLVERKLELGGHHARLYVTDAADRILLVDMYAGLEIYDGDLKAVSKMSRAEILKESEEEAIGHWACHPEGRWLESFKAMDEDSASIVVGKGTLVSLRLSDGGMSIEGLGAALLKHELSEVPSSYKWIASLSGATAIAVLLQTRVAGCKESSIV